MVYREDGSCIFFLYSYINDLNHWYKYDFYGEAVFDNSTSRYYFKVNRAIQKEPTDEIREGYVISKHDPFNRKCDEISVGSILTFESDTGGILTLEESS